MNYWTILESLSFPTIGEPGNSTASNATRIPENLKKIQKSIELEPHQVTEYLINDLKLERIKCKIKEIINDADTQYLYALYLIHVLHDLNKYVDFKSSNINNLVGERHRSLTIAAIEDVLEYGIKLNLHPNFYTKKDAVFQRKPGEKSNFVRTELLIEIFSPLVYIQSLYTTNTIRDVTLCYMAAVYSLLFAIESREHHMDQSQIGTLPNKLIKIWTVVSKTIYYRNLMVLYALLPEANKKTIHKDMLLKLWSSGGFTALVFAMMDSKETEGKSLSQVVSKLVAQPSYPAKAQRSLVKQVLQFITACPSKPDLLPYMGAGLLSLKELIKHNAENKDMVQIWLSEKFKQLYEIEEEQITVMDWKVFAELIELLFQLFCTSTVECLPSDLLLPFLPLLITCHMQIRLCCNDKQVCSQIDSLILNIVNNRQRNELDDTVKAIAFNSYPANWFQLHRKITFEENPLNAMELRIVQRECEPKLLFNSNIYALALVLKESSFSLISFQVFMSLFRLIPSLDTDVKQTEIASSNEKLLISVEELAENAMKKQLLAYELKIDVIKALELLLYHRNLKNIIIENIGDILKVLKEILIRYNQASENVIENESILMILIVLICEIVEGCPSSNLVENRENLISALTQLRAKVKDEKLKFKIIYLQKLICGETLKSINYDNSEAKFAGARSLMEAAEPYQQVEGIEQYIKLIKNKDSYVLNNVHIVTTLALNTLKSSESYTFLNCVRLFSCLIYEDELAVMDMLVDEYSNESAGSDYRLVIGEALLKVCQELGPLCYKYKGLLLNCYMLGCRSPLDVFRFSSFSNLAQMCRILSYQVQSFFQELLHLIVCELTTGKYLPAKRAAVLVLTDLLEGIVNLYEYEDMLLPIYRLLKNLTSSENIDEKIRLHALKGLEILSEKCKALLTAAVQRPLEKEIQILGIGNATKTRSLTDHILYMN